MTLVARMLDELVREESLPGVGTLPATQDPDTLAVVEERDLALALFERPAIRRALDGLVDRSWMMAVAPSLFTSSRPWASIPRRRREWVVADPRGGRISRAHGPHLARIGADVIGGEEEMRLLPFLRCGGRVSRATKLRRLAVGTVIVRGPEDASSDRIETALLEG